MKGILLAGGSGSRLYPVTLGVSKQLLPVYDKPTIYYPLSVLMLAGIREIAVISTPRDLPLIQNLLGTGEQFGIQLTYLEQAKPEGIAQAFLIAEDFLQNSPSCLILGDNLFYGNKLPELLLNAQKTTAGATIFAYHVQDPERYGVVAFDEQGHVTSLEEKPSAPKSNWAATGLYFYDHQAVTFAKNLKPSARGELEITDLNKRYLDAKALRVECMGRGMAWLDTGTHDSLISSSIFVQTIEQRQGLKIACLEEIALQKGFITAKQFLKLAEAGPRNNYGDYLRTLGKSLKP